MKIASIQPLSLIDFPPYCAAVIFTIGCNLRCSYCHNKKLWDKNHHKTSEAGVFNFLSNRLGKLDGVVITGGEPTIQKDLLPFIKKIKALEYKIKLNTNGANSKCLQELLEQNLLDYIAMDIKGPFDAYKKICDADLSLTNEIKKSIDLISASNVAHEFRTIWDQNLLTENDIENAKSMLPKNSKHVVVKI